MAKINKIIYLNDQPVTSMDKIPKLAKLKKRERVHKDYYETEEYTAKQADNGSDFFRRQREMREEMDKYHG